MKQFLFLFQPNAYQLTFHLPLHRYLATFIETGITYHCMTLDDLPLTDKMLKMTFTHLLQIQVNSRIYIDIKLIGINLLFLARFNLCTRPVFVINILLRFYIETLHLSDFVLSLQVCLAEIYTSMWVRNGIQIKGQAMTYIQCHFCYSMGDADLYLMQVRAISHRENTGPCTIKQQAPYDIEVCLLYQIFSLETIS